MNAMRRLCVVAGFSAALGYAGCSSSRSAAPRVMAPSPPPGRAVSVVPRGDAQAQETAELTAVAPTPGGDARAQVAAELVRRCAELDDAARRSACLERIGALVAGADPIAAQEVAVAAAPVAAMPPSPKRPAQKLRAEETQRAPEESREPARVALRGQIVAVFDIDDPSKSFNASSLSQLADYLGARLSELSGAKVVPRDQLRARLSEEKQESYQACFDQTCQIDLGKAMAAQKTLSTKIIKVANRCAITSVLYDLKTETADQAATVHSDCAESGLLEGLDRMLGKLTGFAPT